jgi:hypothetical protein
MKEEDKIIVDVNFAISFAKSQLVSRALPSLTKAAYSRYLFLSIHLSKKRFLDP